MSYKLNDLLFLRHKSRESKTKKISLIEGQKHLSNTYSNSETDIICKSESTITRNSSEDRIQTHRLPIISITRPRFESDSDSCSSRFGTLDDDVFYGSLSNEKLQNRQINPILKNESNSSQVKDLSNALESHKMRRMKMLKVKLQKCRICEENVYFRGYECFQCGLIGHRKCIRHLVIRCPHSALPSKVNVFGKGLEEMTEAEMTGAPLLMVICITEIERRSYNRLKGIYRVSGNSYRVAQICSSFESGPQLIDLRDCNPNDITDVLKIYLNELPRPLFHNELQSELIRVAKEWPTRRLPYTKAGIIIIVFELREIVNQLPSTNFMTLSYLMHHLKRISEHKRETDMTASTLAITFSNLIFRQIRLNLEQTLNTVLKIRAIELLITYATDVFGPQPKVNNHLMSI